MMHAAHSLLVLAAHDGVVSGHRRSDGQVQWSYRCTTVVQGNLWRALAPLPTAVVVHADRVVVATPELPARSRFAKATARCEVVALDYLSGAPQWRQSLDLACPVASFQATLHVDSDLVFVHHRGCLSALELSSGELRWRRDSGLPNRAPSPRTVTLHTPNGELPRRIH